MTSEQFDKLLERRLSLARKVLGTKAGEYATLADRLHNFKAGAGILRTTPAQVCLGFMTKHLVSVVDLVGQSPPYDPGVIDEKIGDAINYLILLEALLREHDVAMSGTP